MAGARLESGRGGLEGQRVGERAVVAAVDDAKLDDTEQGSLLFFVQNGVVNGGYSGPLADPLTLEPSTP
ncbi:MAG: hypothetical protein JOZ69_09745 [Myxococcales bacterium]|nr:hypothetical protein [Myxococcales bacterium]